MLEGNLKGSLNDKTLTLRLELLIETKEKLKVY